jgi:hypothetical protein
MGKAEESFEVYLEVGKKRTFAGAVEWPGWCRSGKSEEEALQGLLDYASRYARVLRGTTIEFRQPEALETLKVIERLEGNATTDFGAPAIAPTADERPIDEAELKRLTSILEACWRTFDWVVEAAEGKELRKGPRGGGRELEGIARHAIGADASYLSAMGWKFKEDESVDIHAEIKRLVPAVREGLAAAVYGEISPEGPRGGRRWLPRYYARRSAWHVLDHVWEIEDRVEE